MEFRIFIESKWPIKNYNYPLRVPTGTFQIHHHLFKLPIFYSPLPE